MTSYSVLPVQHVKADRAVMHGIVYDAEKVDTVSKQVAECLGGKGGGRSGRYQGKAAQITRAQVQEAMKIMKNEFHAA